MNAIIAPPFQGSLYQHLSLDQIVQEYIAARFRRFYTPNQMQHRDTVIGLIGERGSGKSLSGLDIVLRDYLISGDPCWSNMPMKINIKVDDITARLYGNETGGIITYESQYLDKEEFLALSGQYTGGCFFFDEFNIDFGEARRSSSNINLRTTNSIQQLRHLDCGLVYTIINEMYADPRVRENTDIFIKCKDIAYKPENMRAHMEPGHVFEWELYYMTARIAGYGRTYAETHTPLGPFRITLDDLWPAYVTTQMQGAGKMAYSEKQSKSLLLEMQEPEHVTKTKADPIFQRVEKALDKFWINHKDDGEYIEISSRSLGHELGFSMEQWPYILRDYVKVFFLKDLDEHIRGRGLMKRFIIPNRMLVIA